VTPYQRGNRDGLLSLAKQLEALSQKDRIAAYDFQEIARVAEARGNLVALDSARRLWRLALERFDTAQQCHRLALSVAEALPDDPEAP